MSREFWMRHVLPIEVDEDLRNNIAIFETMFIAHAQDDGWMDQEYFFSSRCKRSTLIVMASTSDSLRLVGSYTSKHLLLDVFTKMKIFRC